MLWCRNALAVLYILLCSVPLHADEEKTGYVVKVQERLVYVDLGKSDGVRIGDLFQVFRKGSEGIEEVVGTIRAIMVDDRLSIMEPTEEGVQIAVVDIVKPTVILVHEPPTSGIMGEPLHLSIALKRGGMVRDAVIVYRMAGSKTWMNALMVRDEEQGFSGAIPGRAVMPPFLEYFLRLTRENGKIVSYGSSERPISVVIEGEGRHVTGGVKRPGWWRLLIPGLYQISEGRVETGVSLAVLELGSVGGGIALWPKSGVEHERERRWVSKGLWGLSAVTFLYGILDSLGERKDGGRQEVARVEVRPEVFVERTHGVRVTVRL